MAIEEYAFLLLKRRKRKKDEEQQNPNPDPLCLLKGTMITLSSGKEKPIEAITYDDELLVWDFDNGAYSQAKPLWIMKPLITNEYYENKYSNGSTLCTVGHGGKAHRHFNIGNGLLDYLSEERDYAIPAGRFDYVNYTVGMNVMNVDGITQHLSCVHKKCEDIEYYNIITDRHFNMYANGILTSCRLNNLYPIRNMVFQKECRNNDTSVYEGLPEKYITGLRLSEQTENMREYVENLLSLEWRGIMAKSQ